MDDTNSILWGSDQFRTTNILVFVYRPVYTTFRKLYVCQCVVFFNTLEDGQTTRAGWNRHISCYQLHAISHVKENQKSCEVQYTVSREILYGV
jgi:hypothetical protein